MKLSLDLRIEVWKSAEGEGLPLTEMTIYAGRIDKFGLTAYSDSMDGAFKRAKDMLDSVLDYNFKRMGEGGLKKYQEKYLEAPNSRPEKYNAPGWTKVGEELFHFEKEYVPA